MIRLAIVARVPAPYRIHQHLRVAREMEGEVELHSLFLFEQNNLPWSHGLPDAIGPVMFGPGENVQAGLRMGSFLHERRKMKRVISWLANNNIDAVITVGYSHIGHHSLISWCRRRGIPNFLYGDSNVHGDAARGLKRWLKGAYVRWVVNNVTAVLPHSRYGRAYYEAYGGKDKPMFLMPQEPDYAGIFSVTADQRMSTQRKYGLHDRRRYFLYSGRLADVKRVDTLIDAFARLSDARPDWDLLIVGAGPLERELRARIPPELAARVIWTGFVNDTDEMARLNACADVFVLPSSYEPWALVVCEAVAAGLPVVSSRVVGAAGELVQDGVNGRLFNHGNVDELAKSLLDVTGSAAQLKRLSQGSLEVLDDWRRRADPVQGLRQALAYAGLLPSPAPKGEPIPATPSLAPWRTARASRTESIA